MKKNSQLIAQHSALCGGGHAMKTLIYPVLLIAMTVVGAAVQAQQRFTQSIFVSHCWDFVPYWRSPAGDSFKSFAR